MTSLYSRLEKVKVALVSANEAGRIHDAKELSGSDSNHPRHTDTAYSGQQSTSETVSGSDAQPMINCGRPGIGLKPGNNTTQL